MSNSMARRRIVLFHRMDLTGLFGALAGPLSDEMDVLHLAYGDDEMARLRDMGVTGPVRHFLDEIAPVIDTATPEPALLDEIDGLIRRATGGAFCLNGAIQSDRGFALLDYPEALRLTVAYYRYWQDLIASERVDFVLHEPCTLMFNFLPAVMLADRGGAYLYNIMAQGQAGTLNHLTMTGFDFTCPDLDRALDDVAAGRLAVDRDGAAAFLDEFRASYETFLGGTVGSKVSLGRMAAKAAADGLRNWRARPRHDRLAANIDHWRFSQNRGWLKLGNLIGYRRHLKYDDFDPDLRYFFYPLHLEPEAVVLYHGHGIYENQVKLVQNIAAQLPPDTYLYVKDHPHDQGYRAVADYLAMQRVPNIRVLAPDRPGKEIIRDAEGVITITGTAGFEALLLGKQVHAFGKTFYSGHPRVDYIRNIRDLGPALAARHGQRFETDEDLYPYLTAYFAALQPGLTDYFAGRAGRYGIDLDANARQVAENLAATIRAL